MRGNTTSISTRDHQYSGRLLTRELTWWKRLLDVQGPYRWNLRRLNPGFTLEIGCGLGRNLITLGKNGVGLDHNQSSVEIARSRGHQAFTPESFLQSSFNVPESFDSILMSHVAEHMTQKEAAELLESHMCLLKPGGQVILITPQEFGHRSDPTHVQFMDFQALRNIFSETGLTPVEEYSFPFPRIVGRFFKYNEFISVGKKGPHLVFEL